MLWLALGVATWPFWILVVTFLGFEIWLLESRDYERAPLASLLAIVAIFAIAVFTDAYKLPVTFAEILGFIIAYMIIGAIYAFPFRYWIFVGDKCEAFINQRKKLKEEWNPEKEYGTYNKIKYNTFDEMIRGEHNMPPMPWDRGVKGRCYVWWAYWPLDGFWLGLHRPFEMLWRGCKKLMERIANATYKSYFPE